MTHHDPARDVGTIDRTLRLGGGIDPRERPGIIDGWNALEHRLRSFNPDQVELQLTVKERDTTSQRTTLEAWIAGFPAWSPPRRGPTSRPRSKKSATT